MILREEIKLFTDADGLISPYNLERPGETTNASGNGVLYTGEYIALLKRLGELNELDSITFFQTMLKCMPHAIGLLHRSPTHPDQQGPDDYVGFFVGCYVTGNKELAQSVINYGWDHYGFFNNENPGSYYHKDGRFNWSALLIRQPQLICLAYWAAGKEPNIIFIIYVMFVILFAGRNKPVGDVDSRLLSWLLIQVAIENSRLCLWAAKLWTNRLLKTYPNGMKDVANIAFGNRNPEHPFAKYWPKV